MAQNDLERVFIEDTPRAMSTEQDIDTDVDAGAADALRAVQEFNSRPLSERQVLWSHQNGDHMADERGAQEDCALCSREAD